MLLDFFERNHGVSHLGILYQDEVDQLFNFLICYELRELHLFFLNHLEKLVRVVVDVFSKGQTTTHELIEQNPERPVICFEGIAFSLKHFRSHVVRCPDNSPGPKRLFILEFFGCSHVDQVDLPVVVNH